MPFLIGIKLWPRGGVTEDERKKILANTNERFSKQVETEEKERNRARILLSRDGTKITEEDIDALLKKWRAN